MNGLTTRYVTNPKSHGRTCNTGEADALSRPINAVEIPTPNRSSKISIRRSRSDHLMRTHLLTVMATQALKLTDL
jgi:hypothetical protein